MLKALWLTLYYWLNWIVLSGCCQLVKRRRVPLVKIGSRNGGWVIPANTLGKDSVCYCVGAGEDISFDLGLIKRFACRVYCFDPTPRAIKFVKQTSKDLFKFSFFDYGLWNDNKKIKFFVPPNSKFVSHSVVNLHQTQDFFWGQCYRLRTIMKKLRHHHLDLLKLDIEGAEYEVLKDMIKSRIFPSILCVEFDQPMNVIKTIKMINFLCRLNYSLISQDHFNFTFLYDSSDNEFSSVFGK